MHADCTNWMAALVVKGLTRFKSVLLEQLVLLENEENSAESLTSHSPQHRPAHPSIQRFPLSPLSKMTAVPRSSSYPMIPMSTALSTITASLRPVPARRTPLSKAHGLLLSQDITAPHPIPAFRASIKDGYALRYSSKKMAHNITVIGEVAAGKPVHIVKVDEGEAVYVTTGAAVPDGADCVVMVERTERVNDAIIRVLEWPQGVGVDIREVGVDVKRGEVVLKKGERVGSAEIGILAGCGIAHVDVVRRVVVGVISSGDELVNVADVAGVLEEGEMPIGGVVDSNRPMLMACIAEFLPWCEAVDLGIVRDSWEGVKSGIVGALEKCDVVVTSGGVSMGKKDVIKGVLEEIGQVHFGRVIMKPGKPLTFATVGGKAVIGLPGNPVSAFVCFHLAVCVAVKSMGGWGDKSMGDVVEVRLKEKLVCDEQRPEYHRAIIEWVEGKGYVGWSTGKQASSRLLSARSANALLMLPRKKGWLAEGEIVNAYLLSKSSFH